MEVILETIDNQILKCECKEVYFQTKETRVGILKNHKKENFIITKGLLEIDEKKFNVLSGLATVENNLINLLVLI